MGRSRILMLTYRTTTVSLYTPVAFNDPVSSSQGYQYIIITLKICHSLKSIKILINNYKQCYQILSIKLIVTSDPDPIESKVYHYLKKWVYPAHIVKAVSFLLYICVSSLSVSFTNFSLYNSIVFRTLLGYEEFRQFVNYYLFICENSVFGPSCAFEDIIFLRIRKR